MNNKSRILLTFANAFDMTDEKTGKQNVGCSIRYYFFGENGEMFKTMSGYDGPIGYQCAKCSLDPVMRGKIKKAPAFYDAEFSMSIGSDGKPVMKVVDLEFVGDVYIELPDILDK